MRLIKNKKPDKKLKDCNTTAFNPKMKYNFLVECDDIPSYLIKSIDRPSYSYNTSDAFSKSVWHPIRMVLYDSIEPSTSKLVKNIISNNDGKLGQLKLFILGPVGDVIETITIYDTKIISANFGNLDWSSSTPNTFDVINMKYDNSVCTIELVIDYTHFVLN